MEYPQLCLRRGEDAAIRQGGWWIFDNEIDWVDETCEDGGVVDVLDSRMRWLCRGYFNAKSKITVRVLTRDPDEEIDRDFFRRRIEAAWRYRQSLGFSNACRVVFGESDGLPGLTVDKFGSCLSFQTLALGIERWKDEIVSILAELFQPQGIYERNDVPVREKEGMAQKSGCVYGTVPEKIEILEHEARMLVDIAGGQKTGHFLDQQENRGRLRPYCPGRTVLDLCCHTGGFAIHAALYGASAVEAVDVSKDALDMLVQNARLNGVEDRITPVCANVFDLVKGYTQAGRRFDTVEQAGARGRLPGLQGAESALHAGARARRLSDQLLLQPVYDAAAVSADADRGCRRLRQKRPADRDAHAVAGPSRRAGCPARMVFEGLLITSYVNL